MIWYFGILNNQGICHTLSQMIRSMYYFTKYLSYMSYVYNILSSNEKFIITKPAIIAKVGGGGKNNICMKQ